MLDSHYSFFNDDIFLFPFTPQSYLEFYIAKKVTYYTLKVVLDIIFSINYGFEGENVVGYMQSLKLGVLTQFSTLSSKIFFIWR